MSVLGRALLTAPILLTGCGSSAPSFDRLAVPSQDGPLGGFPCPATFIEGVLSPSERWVFTITDEPQGGVRGVIWPRGYAAARSSSGLVLLDEEGRVVAHEGDRLRVGGTETGAENLWTGCRPVVLTPSPTG